MRKALTIAVLVDLGIMAIFLRSDIKDFLYFHPWWHSFLVGLPTLTLPAFAYLSWIDSRKTSQLHEEANSLRREKNRLSAELDDERNKQLQQIAKNTERPLTKAERNAKTLRSYIGKKVVVSEGGGGWPNTPEIVEVTEDNLVTLFTACDRLTSAAWYVQVDCDDLEITLHPQGICPLALVVRKRYGKNVQLGEISKWEDRFQPAATPKFPKTNTVAYATFVRPGSPEQRTLFVYKSPDGSNSFLLDTSTAPDFIGDNVEVSKRFMSMYVDYEAAGFTRRTGANNGGTPHRLFIRV